MILANSPAAAVFVHELSSFDGVFDSGATLAVLKMKTIKEYIRAYLKAFAHAGYHIVHSTPVFEGVTETRITATTFQVVSKTTITVKGAGYRGEAGAGFTIAHRLDTNMPVLVFGSYSNGGGSEHVVSGGAGFEF